MRFSLRLLLFAMAVAAVVTGLFVSSLAAALVAVAVLGFATFAYGIEVKQYVAVVIGILATVIAGALLAYDRTVYSEFASYVNWQLPIHVRDQNGDPVFAAHVTLADAEGNTSSFYYTDATGDLQIPLRFKVSGWRSGMGFTDTTPESLPIPEYYIIAEVRDRKAQTTLSNFVDDRYWPAKDGSLPQVELILPSGEQSAE